MRGGIAHDFNNLLGSILAQAELALTDLPAGAEVAEEIQTIKTIALRGSEIVRELMIFGGQETKNLELIDISKLTLEMVELLRISGLQACSHRDCVRAQLARHSGELRANPPGNHESGYQRLGSNRTH
jgi:signal transduction histidine kinase